MSENLGGLTAYLRVDMKDFHVGLAKAAKEIQNFSTKLEGHLKANEKSFKKLGKTVKKLSGTIAKHTKRAGLAVAAGMAASVKAYASFDDAMTKSTAIMSGVTDQMRKHMEEVAKNISLNSVTSANDLAKAYYYLASAGLDATQAVESLAAVERFAVAGAFDMAKATDLATDAQSALGMTVKDAIKNRENLVHVTDVLVGANTLANASVEQFSAALTSEAGAAMKSFNIELEQGVAVLAAYADQGIKAEHAGSMFGRMLRLLIKGFRENEQAWRDFNVNIYDARGELKPLYEIVQNLSAALEGMSVKEKTAALEMLGFKARTQQAILPLIGLGDRIEEYNRQLEKMGGMTEKVYKKQFSFLSKLKILWNNIKDIGIAVGERLAPSIEKLIESFRKNQRAIEDWAVAFTDRVVFVKDVLWDFLKLFKTDFHAGFQAIFDSIIALVEAFAKTVINLSFRMGKGILKGIKDGLFESKLSKDELFVRTDQLYMQAGGKYEKTPSNHEFYYASPEFMHSDSKLWKEMEEKAKANFRQEKLDSVFKGLTDDINRYYGDALDGIANSSAEAGDIIKKNLDVLHDKDAKRKMETWWLGVKDASKPALDALDKMKAKMLEVTGMGRKNKGKSSNSKAPKGSGSNVDVVLNKEAAETVREITGAIDEEIMITGKLNETRERSRDLVKLQIAAEKAFGAESERTTQIMEEYRNKLQDLEVMQDIANLADRLGDSFATTFEDAILEGRKFSDAMRSLLNDISREIMRTFITKPLANAISGALGGVMNGLFGGGGMFGSLFAHSGGVVGMGMGTKKVSPLVFANAPRLHSGLQADEFPTILQRGETVIPRGQSSGTNVEVNVINQTGKPVSAEKGETKFDGGKYITNVILTDINSYGPIRGAIQGVK